MNLEAQYDSLLSYLRTGNGRHVSDKKQSLENGLAKTSPSGELTEDAMTHDKSCILETTPPLSPTPLEAPSIVRSKAECLSCADGSGNTLLHIAAKRNNVDDVRLLLEKGADRNHKNRMGRTPLHLASASGCIENVQMLLGKDNCNVSSEDNDGMTPLHIACQSGHTKIAGLLLDRGADIDHKNAEGSTPLNLANQEEIIKLLHSKGASFLVSFINTKTQKEVKAIITTFGDDAVKNAVKNAVSGAAMVGEHESLEFLRILANHTGTKYLVEPVDSDNNTPLHLAAMHGHLEIVKILLETKPKKDTLLSHLWPWGNKKIQVNAENRRGETPLHLATGKGHPHGANIYAEDKTLCTPVLTAATHKNIEAFHCLMQLMDLKDDQRNPIFKVLQVKKHQAETLTFLIADKKWGSTLIKSTDTLKNSVLHVAASENNLSAVTVLIEKKVQCHSKNVAEKTPLHLAAEKGHQEIVQKLLDSNPSLVKEVDNEGKSPLHLACQHGHHTVVQLILQSRQYSKDVLEAGDKKGNTPLHFACMGGKESIVKELIMKGANAKTTNVDRRTPLHLAAKHNQVDVIEYVFNIGEEPLNTQMTKEMPRDIWCMTPLHIACQEGHHKVVRVLEPHLSAEDIRAKDMEENTTLHLACEGGKMDTVQLLLDKGIGVRELMNERNVRGEAPIHFAARDGYKDIVEVLLNKDGTLDTLQDNCGFTPLHHAARNNQEKVIEFLCDRNTDLINLEDSNSHTPILTAAARLKVKAFQCLMKYYEHCKENPVFKALESKNNPVAILKVMIEDSKWGSKLRRDTDDDGNTPLHVAAKHGNLGAVKVLLEVDFFSSEMNPVNSNGKTPMHIAAEGGHVHVVRELIYYQSRTKEFKDEGKNTPLHLACRNGHLEVARMLLAPHLLSEKNEEGNAPLHLACMRKGNIGIVKALIAALDSDVKGLLNERNAGNQTPLDLAYQEEDSDISIVLYLIGQGANAGLKPVFKGKCESHRHFNFLDWAIERKHRDIAMKIVESDYWKEALRSCHVVEGSPPADKKQATTPVRPQNHKTEGLAAIKPEGPPPTVKPEGPPPEIMLECFPPAIKSEGPPTIKPEGPLPAIKPEGPPPAVMLECSPPTLKPECSLSVVNTEGHFTETTPMRELIKEMPDVAEKVLDRCTERKKYVYEFLEDFKPLSLPCCQGRKHDDIESRLQNENDHWGPKHFERSNHPLAIMVKYRCSELLKHELVSSFLRQKSRFGAAFYLAEFFLYVLFLAFLTSYALIIPTPFDDICATNASDHPSNITPSLCQDWRRYSSTYILATLTIIFAAIGLLLQFWKFCMLMIRYCSHLTDCKWHNNWKEFLSRSFYGTIRFHMFAFAIAFATVFHFQCPCVKNGQWQVGVLAVFLGWINMISFIKLVPRLGVYLLMFQNVIYSFFKMLLLGLLLIVAFGLAFYMLFRTPSQMRTAFATPARALVKTMTADLDFDGLFHLSDDEDEIAYVGASYLMWIVFVIILAILFQNLLTSVAVGDIQEIRQNALLRQRELHVELLLNLEELFPQTLGDIDEQQNSHKTYRIFEWLWELASGASKVEQVHPLEHRLEQALSEIDSIKQILRDHSRKLEETESTVKQVEGHHEVHENLAQRTSEKLDIMKEQFLEKIEELSRKF